MQDERVGRLIRAVRIRRGWRQLDLAALVGCSQRWIAQIELGRLDATTIGTMRKVGDALEIRVTIDAWWRAGDIAQLLDAVHAGIVERVMRDLVAAGWNAIPELSFNHYGERGSVDIVAWHAATRTLLIIEVKSRIDDVQDLLHTFGRKVRIVPDVVARERGWVPLQVATMLVVGESSAARMIVRRHVTTFDAVWPARTGACKRFIARPDEGTEPFRGGILLLAAGSGSAAAPTVQPRRIARGAARP
jgi:transcriptional regulator with XRE-family HTH domain